MRCCVLAQNGNSESGIDRGASRQAHMLRELMYKGACEWRLWLPTPFMRKHNLTNHIAQRVGARFSIS